MDREDLRTEARGLLLHLIHQLGAEEAVREPRIVLDVRRQHQLTAGLETLQDERREVRPRSVQFAFLVFLEAKQRHQYLRVS